MSSPDSDHVASPASEGIAKATRIDVAHVLGATQAGRAPAGDDAAPQVGTVGVESGTSVELQEAESPAHQLRAQAAQLGDYLRRRQSALDGRESQMHAQIAKWENEARAARISLTERAVELEEKERESAQRETRLEAAEQRLRAASDEAERRQRSLDEREKRLDALAKQTRKANEGDLAEREAALSRRESELKALTASHKEAERAAARDRDRAERALRYEEQKIGVHCEASRKLVRQMLEGVERRRQAVEAEAARLRAKTRRPSPDLPGREKEAGEAKRALESRQQGLDEAEARLASARAEVDAIREQLVDERREIREQARAERQRMATEHRRALSELERKREALGRRSEHVDRCRAALEQLRAELGRMQRETLEIRLATEELWVQLSGSAPPAALTHSLGQARAKLADHYRMANAELAEKKEELEQLRSQLVEELQKVVRKEREVEDWAARRQREVDEQAQRLVAREEELQRQEMAFHDLGRQWQAEQIRYEQEIRRLKSRRAEPEAALVSA